MVKLDELPSEILDHICLQLRIPAQRRGLFKQTVPRWSGLLHLCLTSKALYQAALPHLYYMFGSGGPESWCLICLTRSVAENPVLGGYIQKIDLRRARHKRMHGTRFDKTLNDCLASLPSTGLVGEIVQPDVKVTGNWSWYYTRVLDLLLTKAHRLTSLEVVIAHDSAGPGDDDNDNDDADIDDSSVNSWEYIANFHATDPSFLSRLDEVTVRHLDTVGNLEFKAIVRLMCQTKPRSLTLTSCSNQSLLNFSNWRLPSLLELKLHRAALENDDTFQPIDWFPNLEYLLLYQESSSRVEDAIPSPIFARRLSEAILPLEATLRSLALRLATEYKVNTLESLAGLCRLQHLTIDVSALVEESRIFLYESLYGKGINPRPHYTNILHKLPESLECLCLTGMDRVKGLNEALWNGQFNNQRAELSRLKDRNILPNLKKLFVSSKLGLDTICAERQIQYEEFEHLDKYMNAVEAEQKTWSPVYG